MESGFHVKPSLVRNQSIEMSNFLRRALDLRGCWDSSFSNGPTLFQRNGKPFQLKHGFQHCENCPCTLTRLVVVVHTPSPSGHKMGQSNTRVSGKKVQERADLARPCTNSIETTNRLAICPSQHMAASLVPYIAFLGPTSCTSGLRNSCGDSTAMRLSAGLVKCARFTSMNRTHWVLDDFLNTPFSSRNLSVHANANRNFEQLSGGTAAKNSSINGSFQKDCSVLQRKHRGHACRTNKTSACPSTMGNIRYVVHGDSPPSQKISKHNDTVRQKT